MSLRLPQRHIGDWARDLIAECETSRAARIQAGSTWRQWYLLGSDTGVPARYNKCFPHIQRLSAYLYSPVDVQFSVELEKSKAQKWTKEMDIASSTMSREFHKRGLDLSFGQALDWALVKGCTFVKLIWGAEGL